MGIIRTLQRKKPVCTCLILYGQQVSDVRMQQIPKKALTYMQEKSVNITDFFLASSMTYVMEEHGEFSPDPFFPLKILKRKNRGMEDERKSSADRI